LENYVIVPRVYGSRMKLSTIAVLLSFMAAGLLAGIPGVLLVLPIVASYPIVERIWFRGRVREEAIRDHSARLAG
jgi:predicted PurR-regulated permease PerM